MSLKVFKNSMQTRRFLTAVFKVLIVSCLGNCDCPAEWLRFGGSCYSLVDNVTSWAHAAKLCNLQGGFLAQINNAGENIFMEMISNVRKSWCPGQPDGHVNGEDCVAFSTSKSDNCTWKWTDEKCDSNFSFLCEQREPTGPMVG